MRWDTNRIVVPSNRKAPWRPTTQPRRSKAKNDEPVDPGVLFRTIMDNLKGDGAKANVLSFLDIKALLWSSSCSRDFQFWVEREVQSRAIRWKGMTSRAWDVPQWRHSEKRWFKRSADEIPFSIAASALDPQWEAVPTPSDLFESVATWSGGWSRLLYARETRAKPQPQLRCDGRAINISTLGSGPLPPSALIFDLHCDGEWRWSGLRPLRKKDIDGNARHNKDGYACSTIYPNSKKSLGDETDGALYGDYQGNRSTSYLLSTSVEDSHTWRLSVSLVSKGAAETLIHSVEFVPFQVIREICKGELFDRPMGLPDDPFKVGESFDDVELWKCYARKDNHRGRLGWHWRRWPH